MTLHTPSLINAGLDIAIAKGTPLGLTYSCTNLTTYKPSVTVTWSGAEALISSATTPTGGWKSDAAPTYAYTHQCIVVTDAEDGVDSKGLGTFCYDKDNLGTPVLAVADGTCTVSYCTSTASCDSVNVRQCLVKTSYPPQVRETVASRTHSWPSLHWLKSVRACP